jgi:hypothetical protein
MMAIAVGAVLFLLLCDVWLQMQINANHAEVLSRLKRIEERLDFYDEADTELEPTDIPQAAGEVC